ncbi:hypothetical protein CDD83_3842 [Cordyceps sp. RAO-2017]|nr:hypothetical protein CDD83_3842 [Cordyceps sp. RAO-2017]
MGAATLERAGSLEQEPDRPPTGHSTGALGQLRAAAEGKRVAQRRARAAGWAGPGASGIDETRTRPPIFPYARCTSVHGAAATALACPMPKMTCVSLLRPSARTRRHRLLAVARSISLCMHAREIRSGVRRRSYKAAVARQTPSDAGPPREIQTSPARGRGRRCWPSRAGGAIGPSCNSNTRQGGRKQTVNLLPADYETFRMGSSLIIVSPPISLLPQPA